MGKAMKAKRVSKIAKGRLAKALVLRGSKEKTQGGLTKDMIIKNKRGKLVSKKQSGGQEELCQHQSLDPGSHGSAKGAERNGLCHLQRQDAHGEGALCQGKDPVQCLGRWHRLHIWRSRAAAEADAARQAKLQPACTSAPLMDRTAGIAVGND